MDLFPCLIPAWALGMWSYRWKSGAFSKHVLENLGDGTGAFSGIFLCQERKS